MDTHYGAVERVYRFRLEELFPGETFSLPLRSLKLRERNEINQEFIGTPDAEQDDYAYCCAFLAAALTREPEGMKGFPSDSRSLRERAREYFMSLSPDWEEPLMEVYVRWKAGGRPSFFSPPSDT